MRVCASLVGASYVVIVTSLSQFVSALPPGPVQVGISGVVRCTSDVRDDADALLTGRVSFCHSSGGTETTLLAPEESPFAVIGHDEKLEQIESMKLRNIQHVLA